MRFSSSAIWPHYLSQLSLIHGLGDIELFFSAYCISPHLPSRLALLILYRIHVAGEVVLFVTALPFAAKDRNITLGGMIAAMVLIGLGMGGTTAVIFPFLGECLHSLYGKSLSNQLVRRRPDTTKESAS